MLKKKDLVEDLSKFEQQRRALEMGKKIMQSVIKKMNPVEREAMESQMNQTITESEGMLLRPMQ